MKGRAFFEELIFTSANPISVGNASTAVMLEEPQTNNTLEGGNNGLTKMVRGKRSPTIVVKTKSFYILEV